ncbi:multicopper oxidase domain-containing protein [Tropicimonas sp. IMCC6043]|uniref:multicopper oxidase domain-containing protein n=1 Tax=Tropicimonas sp. IMCC6043 TaxID=2510645 RepID=UPI0026AA1A7A
MKGKASESRRPTPTPLPPNLDMAVTGLDDALRSRLVMEGGAMRAFLSASMNGREVDFREAAQNMNFWSFNGTIGMADEPLFVAARGQAVRVVMQNDTMFPHAMHLDGHHFREVLPGGGLGPLRDTLLIYGDESREIAFVAHNPGDWVFHCHMLTHAASGMMTRIKVLA